MTLLLTLGVNSFDNFGGVYWTKSELSLSKIQRILRIESRPVYPVGSFAFLRGVSARLRFATASKTEKFSLHFFNRLPPKFFSIKETKIFLFCLPANAGIAETLFHPIPPSAESRRAKIPSPRPPSFLPACWKPPAIFSDGGGTSNWAVGEVSYFAFLKRLLFVPAILFLPFRVYAPSISSHPSGCPIPPPPIIFFSPRSVQNKA